MGLIREISTQDAVVYLWRIQETQEELHQGVVLTESSAQRIRNMKSLTHQKGFLAVRKLLNVAGYGDQDLWYDSNGKPHLKDGKFISISHSFEYACLIIGSSNVGIDIEQKREKIIKIAPKFCNTKELEMVSKTDQEIDLFSEIWCVKESMFKMCQSRSLSFKDHMQVDLKGQAIVHKGDFIREFQYHLLDLGDFMLAYAFEKGNEKLE